MTELKIAQQELFVEGFMEIVDGRPGAYIRFKISGDSQPRTALFDTGINRGLALPERDFDYLAKGGLIRKVKENQSYIFAAGIGRGRMGETDIVIPGNPKTHPDRTLAGLSVCEFDCPAQNPLTYLGMEIIKYLNERFSLEMDLKKKTFRIFGGE